MCGFFTVQPEINSFGFFL